MQDYQPAQLDGDRPEDKKGIWAKGIARGRASALPASASLHSDANPSYETRLRRQLETSL